MNNEKPQYINYGITIDSESRKRRRREEKIENFCMAAMFIIAGVVMLILLHGCITFEGDLNAAYYEGYNSAMEAQQ